MKTIKEKTGILLINLGTPDAPTKKAVKRYLREFLFDPKVIQLPAIPRWILVNLIIAPFRSKKSAHAYQQIWFNNKKNNKTGSPLKYYTTALTKKMQSSLTAEQNSHIQIEYAMRYQNPSIFKTLKLFDTKNLDKLIIVPLFPQYSEAATGSAIDKAKNIIHKHYPELRNKLKIIKDFYNSPDFINPLANIISQTHDKYKEKINFDYYLFSYHGLPEKQLDRVEDKNKTNCDRIKPCPQISDNNKNCYRAQCYATTRAIQTKLKLPEDKVITCFQSRLGKLPWIKPYTDDVLAQLARKGAKNILVSSPAFICDCLETIEELGIRAKDDWLKLGGENLILAPCLNDDNLWAKSLLKIALKLQDH